MARNQRNNSRSNQRNPPAVQSRHFVFRKFDTVGAADAMDDLLYLEEAFCDNGTMSFLLDRRRPASLILGRTGAGKTALIEQLHLTQETVLSIPPDGLALTYISNSDILNFFISAGVDMDLFYRQLWRHVFAVEIIKHYHHIVNESARDSFVQWVKERLTGNRSKRDAMNYLLNMGSSFWEESEYRVKEITKTLEKELKQSLEGGGEVGVVKLGLNAESARKLSEEQKIEVAHRGTSVVNKVQMATLSNVIDIIETDILRDDKKMCYITIDRLDDKWVDDKIRYHLIRALIDTAREFNSKIRNLKIIVALREDLFMRVFALTKGPGYQAEKYQSMCLPLKWSIEELTLLLDLRVSKMVKEQYTTREVKLRDILPENVAHGDSVNYLLDRTLLRPRDAIVFLNECIKVGEGKNRLTQAMIYQAEETYSSSRLMALADEWEADYPNLVRLCLMFKKFPARFKRDEVLSDFEDRVFEFLTAPELKDDQIFRLARDKFDNNAVSDLLHDFLLILYRVGVVGVKPESYQKVFWSFKGDTLLGGEINQDATVQIHPGFWRVLGTQKLTIP